MDDKVKRFLKLRDEEENQIVKTWIDDYIGLTLRQKQILNRWEERDYPNQKMNQKPSSLLLQDLQLLGSR